ncbi:MAG: polysaccharide lyase family protein [Thermoguttaceae bacterium]|jgi:hypothetical protein|nr:polysaccharide lyase family protein [Thermoguttaceae bacterium]
MTRHTTTNIFLTTLLLLALCPMSVRAQDALIPSEESDVLFQIGYADARSSEFHFYPANWQEVHKNSNGRVLRYIVGKSKAYDWSPMHLSTLEFDALGLKFTHEIEFEALEEHKGPLYLIVGVAWTHKAHPSKLRLTTNGVPSETLQVPSFTDDRADPYKFNSAQDVGVYGHVVVPIPEGALKKGSNVIAITLEDGSWFFYDYLALREKPEPLKPFNLLETVKEKELAGVDKIVFAVRKPGIDSHWYANFGYYPTFDPKDRPFKPHDGGELRIFDIKTNETHTLIEDKEGSFRDPMVSYDGKKILFSYLKAGTEHYNLYEIDVDGTNLRQITFGDDDDIEACYLPNGDIVFCSTRCNRFVQCWLTSVATIHRCGPNGENIRMLSCNIEQDNTPFMLQNGQILYTRWEYVDRSQVHYHHLWTMNVDGTRQQVFFGNKEPNDVYIDAKAIPDSDDVVTIVSPGHGITDHRGRVAVLTPKLGPDDLSAFTFLTRANDYTDPWAFSENLFMASRYAALVLLNRDGFEQAVYTLPEEERAQEYRICEPRPIMARPKEKITAELPPTDETTGTLILSNIYHGRRMQDVPKGSIKELLVLETLPEPIHYSGGMDMISSGGTFTLERILGTVPVTPEGAAAIKLPANRSIFFIALDHEGRSVKRMHSFTSVMPGEKTSCIGCHEKRTDAPGTDFNKQVFDIAGKPIEPIPVEGVPEVYDFIRDVQPLLDKYCVECHNPDRRDATVDLSHTWTTALHSLSYWDLSRRNMLGDNRNRPQSDFEPYEIGSQASKLYQMILAEHEGVKFSEPDLKILRFWLETGAPYAGTYAANGTGQLGWHYMNQPYHNDADWPENKALTETMIRRCEECHPYDKHPFPRYLSDKFHWATFYNFSIPEKSRMLRAPLPKDEGGLGLCVRKNPDGSSVPIFQNKDDEDYQTILKAVERGREYLLNESPHFSLRTIRPNPAYTKAMIKYGILPKDFDLNQSYDVYETDRAYWKSFELEPKENAEK